MKRTPHFRGCRKNKVAAATKSSVEQEFIEKQGEDIRRTAAKSVQDKTTNENETETER